MVTNSRTSLSHRPNNILDTIPTEEKFFHLSNLPILSEKYITEALETDYQFTDYPNIYRGESSFGHSGFCGLLKNRFGEVSANFCKNLPRSVYNWHIDSSRESAINWVIKTNPMAKTYYRNEYDNDILTHNRLKDNKRVLFFELEEVDYTILKPTLLNTTFNHMVINDSDEDRIILTVTVPATYHEIKEFINILTIGHY
jgi:hypothetical protein